MRVTVAPTQSQTLTGGSGFPKEEYMTKECDWQGIEKEDSEERKKSNQKSNTE